MFCNNLSGKRIWRLDICLCVTESLCYVYLVTQSCLILCDPMGCSLPGSSVHGDSPSTNYWSGLPCPLPGDLPNPGTDPRSPVLQMDSYHLSHQGSLYVSPVFVILGSLDSWVSVNVLNFFMVTNLNLVFFFLMILMQYICWFTWMSTWVWCWDFCFHIGVCVYSHMDAK